MMRLFEASSGQPEEPRIAASLITLLRFGDWLVLHAGKQAITGPEVCPSGPLFVGSPNEGEPLHNTGIPC